MRLQGSQHPSGYFAYVRTHAQQAYGPADSSNVVPKIRESRNSEKLLCAGAGQPAVANPTSRLMTPQYFLKKTT